MRNIKNSLLLFFFLSGLIGVWACNGPLGVNDLPVDTGFPDDFPILMDTGGSGNGSVLTGFGGLQDQTATRAALDASSLRPIVFLHGNGGVAENWSVNSLGGAPGSQCLKDYLLNNGYSEAHLWGVSYMGESPAGGDAQGVRSNIDDVRRFIDAVLEYTGAEKVAIIALSMGDQLARGYTLGFQSNGSFDTSDRRMEKVGSMILFSGGNYGLGSNVTDPDWDSNGSLWNLSENNNFGRYDGATITAPGAIHYFSIFAEYDYPQRCYETYGAGATAGLTATQTTGTFNTSRLDDTDFLMLESDFGSYARYIDRSDMGANELTFLKVYNHIYPIFDTEVFAAANLLSRLNL
jgi:pimeloyl-ACP methyl ester carboxylesterase